MLNRNSISRYLSDISSILHQHTKVDITSSHILLSKRINIGFLGSWPPDGPQWWSPHCPGGWGSATSARSGGTSAEKQRMAGRRVLFHGFDECLMLFSIFYYSIFYSQQEAFEWSLKKGYVMIHQWTVWTVVISFISHFFILFNGGWRPPSNLPAAVSQDGSVPGSSFKIGVFTWLSTKVHDNASWIFYNQYT